ncbi:MAG: helix-turn-helix domain-containing protein [Sphingomonadales bacterium]
MRHFSSRTFPASCRVDMANRTLKDWYGARMVWESDRSDEFQVGMSLTNFGSTLFSVHRSTGGRIINRASPEGGDTHCIIHAALSGSQDLEVDGKNVHLDEGEFTFTSVAKSMIRAPGENVVAGSLHIPTDIVRRYVVAPESLMGRVFPGHGLAGHASSMMRLMLEMEGTRELSEVGGRLSLHVLDLFCLFGEAQEANADRGSCDDKLRLIQRFVLANIHCPELSVKVIGEHFGVTSRYVHMLFARDSDTPSAFIRRQRLERCKAELEDVTMRSRSISDVAFGWGFNDLSHFCRTFRENCGVSARAYRKQALGKALEN